MPTTKLSDIIDVTIFRDLPQIEGPEKTRFFESGIITRNGLLDELANAPGKSIELPYWNDLDGSAEVNYSSDDPASSATPQKVTQGEQTARKAFVNQGWQAADLASELAMGGTAMEAVRARTDRYFARQWQRRLIAATNGVLADNVANDSSDMVIDVAAEATGDQDAATRFNRDAFTEALYTAGDSAEMFTTIAVHSAVMAQMVKNDDIDFIPDSLGMATIPTYMGKRVIVDDGLTVTAGSTNGFKYTSVLFGPGAFGYGVGSPITPVAIDRNEEQGDGGGIETLWVRNTWLLHPFGFEQTGTPSGISFTQAELATAAVWSRVLARKLVPLSYLVTN
jgi:hypothetical protein